jgi:hypothetical protein
MSRCLKCTDPTHYICPLSRLPHSLASCSSSASHLTVASGGATAQSPQHCTDHRSSSVSSSSSTRSVSSCHPTTQATGVSPSEALQLLLQLFRGLEHHPAQSLPQQNTRSSACGPKDASLATGSSEQLLLLLQANCICQPGLGLQLEMLVGAGEGQMSHIVAGCSALPTAAARPLDTTLSAAAATAAEAAADAEALHQGVMRYVRVACSQGACCAAGCEVLRCMTALVLMDMTGAAATNPRVLQGEAGSW